MHGYDLEFRNSLNKGGGGEALFVNKDMKYTRIEVTSTASGSLMECITSKLIMEDVKNILISCIYRALRMGTFGDWLQENFLIMNNKKF